MSRPRDIQFTVREDEWKQQIEAQTREYLKNDNKMINWFSE